MKINFDVAFDRLLGHEGGYQNDPQDRGNWTTGVIGRGVLKGTRWGISAMSYPDEDIRNLSKERAKDLYKRDFWNRVKGDDFHAAIIFQLFDAAVNHGPGTAVRLLQRAVGVADDGYYGPVSYEAVQSRSVDDVLVLFNAERLEFFTKISTWPRYGKGWARRIVQNLRYGAEDYTAPWYVQLEVK